MFNPGSTPLAAQKLVKTLAVLPSIGPKMAERLAVYLLTAGRDQAGLLVAVTGDALAQVAKCDLCGNLALRTEQICSICADSSRDQSKILVVETVQELYQVERTGSFDGLYHVTYGLLSPINGITSERLGLASLATRIHRFSGALEVIFALPSSVEGVATVALFRDFLAREAPGTKFTQLAKGIPSGVGVEYLDKDTLRSAIDKRTE